MLEAKNNYKAWLYLAPVLILMGIFTFYPIVNSFLLVFQDWGFNSNNVAQFHGLTLNNFAFVLTDPIFARSIGNTITIVLISVPCSITLSLLIAVALNSIKPLQKFFQTLFFIPYVTNAIAIGMVFSVIFDYQSGLFNMFLDVFNIAPVDWIGLDSTHTSRMFVLIVYIVWSSLAFKILLILSALQSVDKQYYQAAQIDHASKFTVLRRITVPMISPIIAYLTITSFIGAFKEYSSIIGIFGDAAGPAGSEGSMGTIVWYIYQYLENSLYANPQTIAAAAAVVLLGIIMCITAVNMYVSSKKVHF